MSKGVSRAIHALERWVASPYFQWVAIGLGIVFYGVLERFAGPAAEIPEEILETPTPAFISAVFVLGLWALKLLIVQTAAAITRPRPPREVIYKDLEYFWSYGRDGSLQGVCVYELENRTQAPLDGLPYEALVWFKGADKKKIKFRIIYRDGDVQHRFESSEADWTPLQGFVDLLRGRTASDLSWSPKIAPPIAPGETILYEVEISTPKTERDAFGAEGTIVGFPVRRYTNHVSLTARAPQGFRFSLRSPKTSVLVIDTGASEPRLEASLPVPSISIDGSVLTWSLDFPTPGYRYWINYRFEPKN